jgi:hypothetical protein
MAQAATQALAARFGELLTWAPAAAGGWEASGAGRTLRLVWVAACEASTIGTPAGWHLDRHPDPGEHRDGLIGPHVGGTLPVARRLAEAWALTPSADHCPPGGGVPSIITVLATGAVFRGPSGALLAACAEPAGTIGIRDCQDARRWRDCPLAGQVRPVAARSTGTVSVTWQPESPDGIPAGPERHSWQAAARSVAARAAIGSQADGGVLIPWPGSHARRWRRA